MRHTYAGPREKRIDFWLGFALWFLGNIVIYALGLALSTPSSSAAVPLAVGGLVILLNLAVPIVLAFTRPYTALGILVAFATGFALAIVEGVFFTVSDFVGGTTNYGVAANTGVAVAFLVVGFILFAIGAFFVLRRIHRGIQ